MNRINAHRDLDFITIYRGEGRGDLRHAGGNGHGHGQDVVGEQGSPGNDGGQLAQIIARDDIRPAAGGVGVDGLLVRKGEDGQQNDDGPHDGQRERQRADPCRH